MKKNYQTKNIICFFANNLHYNYNYIKKSKIKNYISFQ
jgi:hypothetical protein